MTALSAGLYVLAYLSAVVDGVTQDTALYPSDGGKLGLKRFGHKHPWLIVGAIAGVGATIVAATAA